MLACMDIAHMTQFWMKYVQDRNAEAKQRTHKHAFLAGAGKVCLLTIGIVGLIESRRNDYSQWL